MSFPTEIGVVKWRKPLKGDTMMFTSLAGMARDNTKMIDGNGNLHVTLILDGLDSLYGVSMTFQSLNPALCGLQQKPFELAYPYYNHMAQIIVILLECHGNQYRLNWHTCPKIVFM